MAADGATTLGSVVSGQTVQQRTAKKLEIVQGKIVVGVSGYVGLGQRLRAEIDDCYSAGELKGMRPEKAGGVLRKRLWENVVGPEMVVAAQAGKLLGQSAASQSAVAATLVAMPLDGEPHLVQFDHQCSPEFATDNLPFVTIGSGQGNADPFLSFNRKTFWPQGCPSLQDGVFSAVWTVRHAIDNAPGGLADPIQVVVLEKTGKNQFEARELSQPDLDDHIAAVREIDGVLQKWRTEFTERSTAPAPKQPPE